MRSSTVAQSPDEIVRIAQELGRRIAVARKRRRIRQEDLAARTGLSRSSIQSVERGDLSCSLGIVLHVLWNLGLAAEVALIADPGLDRDGLALALDVETKRVCVAQRPTDDF